MRRERRTAAMLLVIALAVVWVAPAAGAKKDTNPGLPVMAGLGDSWTFGQGAADPATGGYFALAHQALQEELDCLPAASDEARDGCKHLQAMNIARPALPGVPGVTTDAVIEEQLPVMVLFLEDRNGDANPRNDVEIIYLSAGGNDISSPVIEACLFGTLEQCLATMAERLNHVGTNMHHIVGSLRAAAGPDTPIVIVTYDNPIPNCALGAFPGATDLGWLMLGQLNAVMEGVAAAHGATVAATLGRLGADEWVGGPDCLHPNGAGHQTISQIAAAAAG